jgi:archaellum component FlaC
MNTEELTHIVTAHQTAITRHDLEMADIRTTLNTVGQRLDKTSERLDKISERLDSVSHKLDRVADQQEANARQAAFNQEAIANLTAGILDLRNIVSDYLQGRSQL